MRIRDPVTELETHCVFNQPGPVAGFIEKSALPKLYREAPLNRIWEGSGNVMCLDVLRTLKKQPETAQALIAELKTVAGSDDALDRRVHRLETRIRAAQPADA